MTPASVLPDILQMSEADRIELAHAIWDSVVEDNEPIQLTEAQKRELDRRLEEREQNPDAGISWEELKAKLLADSP